MSTGNGVIRVARKGLKKFAFGDGDPFEVDVVVAWQRWVSVDAEFRELSPDGVIPLTEMRRYHEQAVEFVVELAGQIDITSVDGKPAKADVVQYITTAEALDFIARLRECYDELVDFFRPKSRAERESPDSSGVELRFSLEPEGKAP